LLSVLDGMAAEAAGRMSAGKIRSLLWNAGHCLFEDLGGDLHGADLAAVGAGALGLAQEPPLDALAHGDFRVVYPARVARVAGELSWPGNG
jgi:hypothetical protein